MIQHHAELRWTRAATDAFTDRRYSRAHAWHFDGGARVAASSSPHAVPTPFSCAEHVDPEEALVAATSSCHMLAFLFEAARAGYVVDRYEDRAVGEQGRNADGRTAVTRIVLRPAVAFAGPRAPDAAAVDALHARAHAGCVIANSLRAPVACEGTWTYADASAAAESALVARAHDEPARDQPARDDVTRHAVMRDVALRLDDRPGALAAMGDALGRAGVSIEGGGAWTVDGRGVAHFLFADGDAARRALAGLEAEGIAVLAVRDVVVQRLAQAVPGQLGALTRRMAEAGVNIEVLYSDHDHRLVLVVDDVVAGRRVAAAWARGHGESPAHDGASGAAANGVGAGAR